MLSVRTHAHSNTHTSVAFSELLKNDAPFKQFLLAVLTLNSQADRCIQFSWKRCISMQTLANERDIHTFKYTTIFLMKYTGFFSSIFLSIFYSKSMCLFYLIFCYNFFFSFVRFVHFIRRRKTKKDLSMLIYRYILLTVGIVWEANAFNFSVCI